MVESRAAVGSQNFGGVGSPSALIGAGLDESGAHQVLDAAADPDRVARMTIVDKVGVVEMDGELQLDLSFDTVLSQAATSRTRLGVDAVHVVLAHAPDLETSAEETLDGFGSLISEGSAGGWGVSNIDGRQLLCGQADRPTGP